MASTTTTQTITVDVPPPVAAFNAAPSTGTAPLTVQFNDTSSGAITSRAWTIGNDTISGSAVPLSFTWVFEETGTYTAILTVNGPGGTDTRKPADHRDRANTEPTVMISSPESGASFPALTNVMFAGSAMDAEDGNISPNIEWSSSINGSIGTGSSFSKGNLSPGQHTITASVTDSSLSTVTKQITVTTTALPPPTLPDPPGGGPGDCGGRRCEPRDPGDGPPDQL